MNDSTIRAQQNEQKTPLDDQDLAPQLPRKTQLTVSFDEGVVVTSNDDTAPQREPARTVEDNGTRIPAPVQFGGDRVFTIGEMNPFQGSEDLFQELVSVTDKEILAFVSDTHFGRDLDDFDKDDQEAFIRMLEWLKSLGKDVTLVLLGDIFEIWESVLSPSEREAARRNTFAQRLVREGRQLTERQFELIQILVDILTTHRNVANAMADFIRAGNKIIYCCGNHDDELADDTAAQRTIREFIPDIEFRPTSFLDNAFELYAEHGHRFDRANCTKDGLATIGIGETGKKIVREAPCLKSTGKSKPFGRKLVEGFVTRIEAVSVNGTRPFRNIDAFSPIGNYLDYYNCIKQGLSMEQQIDLDEEMKQIVNEFVQVTLKIDPDDLPSVLNDLVSGGGAYQNAINFIKVLIVQVFNLAIDFDDIARGAAAQPSSSISNEDANFLLENDKSCVVMGHTHEGFIRENQGGLKGVYINTGTWMDKVQFDAINPCSPVPKPSRHVTVLVRTIAVPASGDSGGITEDGVGGQSSSTGVAVARPSLILPFVNAWLFSYSDTPTILDRGKYWLKNPVLVKR